MAETLVDGEFWLPSEFLTDDDPLLGNYHLSSHRHSNVCTAFNRLEDVNFQSSNAEMRFSQKLRGLITLKEERRRSGEVFCEVWRAYGSMFDPWEDNTKPAMNHGEVVADRCAVYVPELQKIELMRQRLILKHLEKLWSEESSMNTLRNRDNLWLGGYYHQPRSSLNANASRTQRAGTGVFLPRRCEGRKTAESPNVLFPARVVQALNLNVDGFSNIQGRYYNTGDVADAALTASFSKIAGDVRLPAEWTY